MYKNKTLKLLVILLALFLNCNARSSDKGNSNTNIDVLTTLHQAVADGNQKAIASLIKLKKLINSKEPINGSTPLHIAARYAYTNIIKMLLESGANAKIKDHNGWTALHEAVLALNNQEVIELLLKYGAEINAKTNDGHTPLKLAQAFGRSAYTNIDTLRKHKAE